MNRAGFVDTRTRAGTRVVRDTLMVIGPPLRQLLKNGHRKGCTRCSAKGWAERRQNGGKGTQKIKAILRRRPDTPKVEKTSTPTAHANAPAN